MTEDTRAIIASNLTAAYYSAQNIGTVELTVPAESLPDHEEIMMTFNGFLDILKARYSSEDCMPDLTTFLPPGVS